MNIEDLRHKFFDRLPLIKEVAASTEFLTPDTACRAGTSRFSDGIETGGVLRRYDHALHFFEAATHAFSVVPRERCLYLGTESEASDEKKIFYAWESSFAISIISGAINETDVPERDSMRASAEAQALVVSHALNHYYKNRADMYVSASILDCLCLAYLLPVWGFGKMDERLVERCLAAKVHKPFEAMHRATSEVVRNPNAGLPEFDRAYSNLVKASNFIEGLLAGLRIIHVFHLSLVRNGGRIRPSIERLFPENEQ